jgi:membrane protein DedA with SNARE-associated domain
VWCTVLTSVGYGLGSSYHRVLKAFSYAGYVAAVLVVIAVVVLFIHRLRVVRSERAAAVNESAQVQR